MGTRALIGYKTMDSSFNYVKILRGVYHHWDGYPTGVGRKLYDLMQQNQFEDVNMLLGVLLSHPTGYSSLMNWDGEAVKLWPRSVYEKTQASYNNYLRGRDAMNAIGLAYYFDEIDEPYLSKHYLTHTSDIGEIDFAYLVDPRDTSKIEIYKVGPQYRFVSIENKIEENPPMYYLIHIGNINLNEPEENWYTDFLDNNE